MTCAACSSRVEKAARSVEGVTDCSVNLLTGDMLVEGGSAEDVISAVTKAGYGAECVTKSSAKAVPDGGKAKSRALTARLCASAVLLVLLMYVSMGHVMYGFPFPSSLAKSPSAIALIQLLLSACVLVINGHFFKSGVVALVRRSPNMDTLVSMGSGVSFCYSVFVLFKMILSESAGDVSAASHMLHELYFESAAMILTLITVGKLLESIAKGKTTDAVRSLMELSPKTATVLRDGKEMTIHASELKAGELFVVRAG